VRLGPHDPRVAKVSPTDVILRASVDGMFHVLDAATTKPLSGLLTPPAALAFAEQLGATHIYQQPVDERGRVLSEPCHFHTVER
jgi:hypothetical protein